MQPQLLRNSTKLSPLMGFIPEMVVSDNGSGFASEEFADFMARNGIHKKQFRYVFNNKTVATAPLESRIAFLG